MITIKMYSSQLIWFSLLMLSVVVLGCGSRIASSSAPTIISTVPDNNASDVPANRKITATFSTSMNATTLNTSTFTLTSTAGSVSGSVAYYGKIAVFTPDTNLTNSTQYSATITTGAKSIAGTALATNYVWTFTTGSTPDTTNPDVNSTTPLNLATGVAINRDITATFDGHMNPADINTTNFTLTTAAGPNPVNFGTAGTFAIFTNTGISNAVTPAAIIGDMGTGPGVTSTAITGFALTAAGEHATSTQVTGNIYAFDYASPTPAKVTTASNDMTIAYNDAAGRLLPDTINLATGNLAGQTLLPGLYRWNSSVNLPVGTDVTLSGGANDVWILQITGTLTTVASTHVYLTGGALPKNVFWQVAGSSVTLGASSLFQGVVLAKAAINVGNQAVLNSILLAQKAVNLSENNVTKPTP